MLNRMAFGIIFFGCFTSPLKDNPFSAPTKAKNKIKDISPILAGSGVFSQ